MVQFHHVLPKVTAVHEVIKALGDRFKRNSVMNMMALPSSQKFAAEIEASPHTGGHLGSYGKGLNDVLTELQGDPADATALAGDPEALDRLLLDVSKFVVTVKYALAKGHLLTNTPTGMTRELANEQNVRWFANWKNYSVEHHERIEQMRKIVDELEAVGPPKSAKYWPLLAPTDNLNLAEKIALLERTGRESPIRQHFTAAGPVPNLRGLIPSVVDTRLPGSIPPQLGGLDRLEGFAPINPHATYGLPGFLMPTPASQKLLDIPPSSAPPPEAQVLQFHSETGWPLTRMSDGSPVTGPPLPQDGFGLRDLYGTAALLALTGATVAAPQGLPVWARLAAGGLASAPAVANAKSAEPRAQATRSQRPRGRARSGLDSSSMRRGST